VAGGPGAGEAGREEVTGVKRTYRLEGWIYLVSGKVEAHSANEAKRKMITSLETGRARFIPSSEENLNDYFDSITATEV
jgi:hypothetical protein